MASRNRVNVRAGSLAELADEFGITLDTLISWIDKDTIIGMVNKGYNPFTMSRILPPSILAFLRERWGKVDE